jgi:hypothetical protein
MVANCANPACNTRFKYSSQGKLFSFELAGPQSAPTALLKQEWFWLCAACSREFTLQCSREWGVLPVPLSRPRDAECA